MNVYLDTSVVLAELLTEDHKPPKTLWKQTLFSSRLLEYELMGRLHAKELYSSHGEAARRLLSRMNIVELASEVLARALEPFPQPVRTLDALHLASMDFLRQSKLDITLASFDRRMCMVAQALGWPMYFSRTNTF